MVLRITELVAALVKFGMWSDCVGRFKSSYLDVFYEKVGKSCGWVVEISACVVSSGVVVLIRAIIRTCCFCV